MPQFDVSLVISVQHHLHVEAPSAEAAGRFACSLTQEQFVSRSTHRTLCGREATPRWREDPQMQAEARVDENGKEVKE